MARKIDRLTDVSVRRAKKRGYLADGGGLYLQITASGAKSWVFRFRDNGRLREAGLGPAHTVTLAKARERAHEYRNLRLEGIDPIEERKAGQLKAKLEAAKAMTFKQCAEAYIEAHKGSWRNDKHAAQWPSTLETYAYPVFGDLPVQAIDVTLVSKVLEPIWKTKTETASRLRGRIERVLDWATVRKYRQGDNPARWRGHLDQLLPPRAKLQKVQHHAALPYAEIGAFMAKLREQDGMAALALELLILTATRTGEVIGSTWDEIDLGAAVWTIPADRMKGGKEHRVPLSKPALAVLKPLRDAASDAAPGTFVFPGLRADKPLSNKAMLKLLERMERSDLTVHGFRSTFRDWVGERTNFPREVAEHALAHSLPDKVEAAYRRGDLFDKRIQMMDAWAKFCAQTSPEGKVVPIGARSPAHGRGTA
jgi:integrase